MVHEKEEAKEIFKKAKINGENVGITSPAEKLDASFETRINVPSGEEAYFWLTYEQQLARSNAAYKYETNIITFGPVQQLDVFVHISESRNLRTCSTTSITQFKIENWTLFFVL